MYQNKFDEQNTCISYTLQNNMHTINSVNTNQ